MNSRISILFITPGPMPPPDQPRRNRYSFLEAGIHIDEVQTCSRDRHQNPAERFNLPNARYHFTYSSKLPEPLKMLWDVTFFVLRGLWIFVSRRRFRLIVAYGTTRTAVAALVLKWLTRARLIIDIPGDPRTAYVSDSAHPTHSDRFKLKVSHVWTRFLLRHVDRVKLLFPEQIDIFPEADRVPRSVFAEFVAVSSIDAAAATDERYVLFLGFPWHLKGVDILIEAFKRISPQFPDQCLKVVGHCPDRDSFEALRGGNAQIEFHKGVPHSEALQLISRCTCLVLPSRTEGMGRVLLEAMAAGKAVIASRVGGIPSYLLHGETGLLFETENVEQLAACLAEVLGDVALRNALGRRALEYVRQNLTEHHYANRFGQMVRHTLGE